jgi:putative peptidoglycan lipid II flippase
MKTIQARGQYMAHTLHKKSIIRQTIKIGNSTLASRFLGVIRELLLVRYLGAQAISDAFLIAYKLPNSLRKIFAEGALSAAFIPSFITALRHKESVAHGLMSLAFLVFEGILLIVCALTIIFAPAVIHFAAPGFSAEQTILAIPLLRILMPFIFFISSSALLAGALQAVGHFFVPAFGPILLNIVFIIGLCVCWFFNLPVIYLCFFILLGGLLQFLQHVITYFKLNFTFGPITPDAWHAFKSILSKFFLCALSMSVIEINFFIDTQFASYLPAGSISLITYAFRFVGIPLGVFASAFSTILLPHFSRISIYAPKRLNFYILESAKLVFWITIPCMLALVFFADKIFITLFGSKSLTMAQAHEAGSILIAFAIGLFFFSLNKILLNVFYALHATGIPGAISVVATISNILLNFLLIKHLQGAGLALATSIAGAIQTFLLFYFLRKKFGYHCYLEHFWPFLGRYLFQLAVVSGIFLISYSLTWFFIAYYMPSFISAFLLYGFGFWVWAAPLCLAAGLLLYWYKDSFGVRLYFLD